MELRIDLTDRDNVEAAHSLLSLILTATDSGESVLEGIIQMAIDTPVAIPSGANPVTSLPANLLDLTGTQDGVVGNGAPSAAGAAALPNVPEGLLAGAQNDTSVSTSPVAPSAPQAPVAPSEPAAPASPAAGAVTLDKSGLPWDKRIHSSPPSLNKGDGMWRAKKGLNDAALVKSVETELRALMAIPTAGGAATATAPAAVPASAPPAPIAPAAPTPPATPAAPAAATSVPSTPQELIPRVTAANAAGTLPPTALLEACAAYGIPNIPGLFQRPDKVAEVYAYLQACHPGFA